MNSYWTRLLSRLWEEPGSPPAPWFWRLGATLLSWGYGAAARSRRLLYEHGWRRRQRLPCPVISIGNLTVGGTGKTPLTIYLARQLQEAGLRPTILTRGYGGRERQPTVISDGQQIYRRPPDCGDEAYLLARKLPGVPVVSGVARAAAGDLAWQRFQPDCFLLDDGFQHLPLARDLDIVLLDADRPWGNGRLLPRGPLREPPAALQGKPVWLLLTRYQSSRHELQWQRLRQALPTVPMGRAVFRLDSVTRFPEQIAVALESLTDLPLVGFAGLAQPYKFAASLAAAGLQLRQFYPLADHQPFTAAVFQALERQAREVDAAGLITTEKDWCRLAEIWPLPLPLYVVSLKVELLDPWPPVLQTLLSQVKPHVPENPLLSAA